MSDLVATHLLWHAAGRPTPEQSAPGGGRCWWCGVDWVGPMRTIKSCPNTFVDAVGRDACDIDATHLCGPCAWTLSDRAIMPPQVSGPRLLRALDGDGRSDLALDGAVAERVCVLRLDDGRVGVWPRTVEPAWKKAKAALAADPHRIDSLPPTAVLSLPEATARLGAKFRNHIAFGTESGRWEMWTKADKAEIRAVLCDPPQEPWTLSIGDGQKHAAILGVVSDGRDPVQQVYLDGAGVVTFQPAQLAALLVAVETLLVSGANEEDVISGQYTPRGMPLLLAMREHEPTVAKSRGPRLLLALWLRRSIADLKAAEDIDPPSLPGDLTAAPVPFTPAPAEISNEPGPRPDHRPEPRPDEAVGREPRPAERGGRPPVGQLSLFG